MTPERWAEIEEIFHRAAECDAKRRAALLDEACNGDLEMRREVETLLSSDISARTHVQAAVHSELDDFGFSLEGEVISHYRILDGLGGGGMGLVYRAEDIRLGRQVALKFLPEESAKDPSALARFEREARAASALEHPNICPIYEFGEHNGQPFLVMQLLEGQILGELISDGGIGKPPMPLDKLLDLAIQLGDGLDAAHKKGIIHRDIKPANVFVTTQGRVKILDFGLAKLLESEVPDLRSRDAADEQPKPEWDPSLTLTCAGVAMGTAGYMSPEQVRGERLDARTDLFSFGLVLYEMTTGKRAFAGNTVLEVHDAILRHAPPSPRQLNPEIPLQLELIINRVLAKDRESRYQSAAEVLVDLRRLQDAGGPAGSEESSVWRGRRLMLALSFLAALAIIAVTVTSYLKRRQASRLTEQDTVVVADFVNSTGDSVFDGTLKQALDAALRQSPFLDVLPGSKISSVLASMKRPIGTPLAPETAIELCQRVGGKAYITGTIGSLGSEYVLSLYAVKCQKSGETLAHQQVTAPSKDKVLDALGTAAARLRGELGESMTTVRQFDVPLSQATTSSLEALKEYSLGNKAGAEKGQAEELRYYLRAIQLDPNFAMAYFDAGKDFLNAGQSERGTDYITKAYQLRNRVDARESEEITSGYFLLVTGELDKAAQSYERTIKNYPHLSSAYSGLALLYAEEGRYEEAAAVNRRLLALRPDLAGGYENLALNLLCLQHFDEARQTAQAESAQKLDTYARHKGLYALAFVTHDSAAMAEQLAWFAKNPTFASLGIYLQGETDAYAGHLRKAREATHQLVSDIMLHSPTGGQEGAAKQWDNAALREAMFGNTPQAQRAASAAVKISPSSQRVEFEAALAFAMVGDTSRAEALAQDVNRRFPLHTQVQSIWLPTIDAQLALARKKPAVAIDRLQAAANAELGFTPTHVNISCLYAPYVRGQAYLANNQGSAAAGEFQKILDHSGIVWNCPTGALAHLGLARANVIQSRVDYGVAADAARARAFAAYEDFFELWKDADLDLPILKQAKAEYARLRKTARR